ncbi:MAG: Asp-tRNA(Asn)/Glu-tRNA(Gln) amidotransferase subunit GatB [Candidatus Methanospirareceae archaeon]
MEDDVKIGLECHAQLLTKSKLFCSCSTSYHGSEPNTHVCATCLGLPGALPVVNKEAIRYAIKVAIALGCKIQEEIIFYRKNYYYPDLPKGFQISQYDFPIAFDGFVRLGNGGVRIKRVHLEEDPGRLVYKGSIDTAKYSLVDYNRSGIPLVEIVTEPDIKSPKEARLFIGKIRTILEYLGVFDGSMEGAMRIDANISVEGGERVEIKNISSYKGVEKALSFEITRQRNLLRRGLTTRHETRHYDEERGITVALRTKEFEEDYRYFPEPDLVPIRIGEWVEELKKEIPEMPDEKKERFMREYGITEEHANALIADINVADFYEEVAEEVEPKLSATWVVDVLKGELNYRSMSMKEALKRISAKDFATILKYLQRGTITERGATEVIREMLDKGGKPEEIVQRKGLISIGVEKIKGVIQEVLEEKRKAVEDYKSGKKEALHFLVGEVMKKTRGKANPQEVYKMMREELEKGSKLLGR